MEKIRLVLKKSRLEQEERQLETELGNMESSRRLSWDNYPEEQKLTRKIDKVRIQIVVIEDALNEKFVDNGKEMMAELEKIQAELRKLRHRKVGIAANLEKIRWLKKVINRKTA